MTPENFCYWLQGLLEIGDPSELDSEQVEIIKEHLNLVFKKETETLEVKFRKGMDWLEKENQRIKDEQKLSDYLLSPIKVEDRFKITQDHIDTGKELPDYINPWITRSPQITC